MNKVEALAAKVDQMSLSDQLRLAAALLDQQQYDTARVLAKRVIDLLTLKQLLAAPPAAAPR